LRERLSFGRSRYKPHGLVKFLDTLQSPEFALKYFRGKALGFIVPPTLLAAANELIE